MFMVSLRVWVTSLGAVCGCSGYASGSVPRELSKEGAGIMNKTSASDGANIHRILFGHALDQGQQCGALKLQPAGERRRNAVSEIVLASSIRQRRWRLLRGQDFDKIGGQQRHSMTTRHNAGAFSIALRDVLECQFLTSFVVPHRNRRMTDKFR